MLRWHKVLSNCFVICSLMRFSTHRENKKEGSHTSMTKLRNDSDNYAFTLTYTVDSDQWERSGGLLWSRVVGLLGYVV